MMMTFNGHFLHFTNYFTNKIVTKLVKSINKGQLIKQETACEKHIEKIKRLKKLNKTKKTKNKGRDLNTVNK